ncbi:MAG: LysR family transcriptional regulator [Proteobacteria bacterium]|nr:LysR family transcriptional regulator [Pseudomonadota bacterium]
MITAVSRQPCTWGVPGTAVSNRLSRAGYAGRRSQLYRPHDLAGSAHGLIRKLTQATQTESDCQQRRITVSQLWYPRSEVDPAHRWLRQFVLSVCRTLRPG